MDITPKTQYEKWSQHVANCLLCVWVENEDGSGTHLDSCEDGENLRLNWITACEVLV